MRRDGPDDVGDEGVAAAGDLVPVAIAADGGRRRERAEAFRGAAGVGRDHDGPLRAVPLDERGRRVDVDDARAIQDGHAAAQALGLLHQVGGQDDRLAAFANVPHEVPDRPSGLRIQSRRQLVEEHDLRVVHECEGDEEALLLPAGERHEPRVALLVEPELPEQPVAVGGVRIERLPEGDRLPHLDPLLELRLLQLHPDAELQRAPVADRVESEDLNPPRVGCPQPFDALQRRRLPGAVRSDEAEDLAPPHRESDVGDGNGPAVGLANAVDLNDVVRVHAGREWILRMPIQRRRWSGSGQQVYGPLAAGVHAGTARMGTRGLNVDRECSTTPGHG